MKKENLRKLQMEAANTVHVFKILEEDEELNNSVFNAWAFVNPDGKGSVHISLVFGITKEYANRFVKRLAKSLGAELRFSALAPTEPFLTPIEDGITIQLHGFPRLLEYKKIEKTDIRFLTNEMDQHLYKEEIEDMLLKEVMGG